MAKSRQTRQRRAGFARAREAAGLTQEAFAMRAGVEVSTVVRWESGCTRPLPGKRPQIARVLGVGLPELERLLSPESAGDPGPGGLAGGEEADDAGPRTMQSAGPRTMQLAAIASVREETAKLTAEYEARPGAGLIVRAAGLLGRVEALRSGSAAVPSFADSPDLAASADVLGSPSPPTASSPFQLSTPQPSTPQPLRWRRDLDIAEAEAALIVGRLLWDAAGRRDSSAAEEFFDRAARRASQAGDSVLQVTASLRAAFIGLYGGDPRAGLRRCVQAAVIAAPVSEALFALARLHAAEGLALLGRAAECDRALVTARGAMAAIGADDPAPGVCTPRTYQRLAGAAYLALGRYAEARSALTEAAARHEPGKVLAVVLGHLALACLGEGDIAAALRHVRSAIELADHTRSVGALAVAFRAGREIVRGCAGPEPEVLEIVDQLLAVIAA